MSDAIWLAIALVLILEGIGPLLFPNKWQNYIRQISSQAPNQLRTIGGTMVTIGVITLYYMAS